ncbi:hypothetical protein D9M71_96060 [compost metagenome]
MVQRQGAIDDILGAHVQGDHAEARRAAHPATVLEHAGLGQPRGARGVDIKAGIVEENLLAAGWVVAGVVEADSHQVDEPFRRDTRLARGVLIGDEPGSGRLDRHPISYRQIRRNQLLTDNDRHRRHQIHTVHQGIAGLRGIEQGTDRADLGHRQNRHQQFRAVLDEDRHHVALADTLADQVMGDAVGPLVDLAVTERDVVLQQRRAIRVAQCGLFETPAQTTRLGRVLDVGGLHAPHHPGDGLGDGRQLAEHHAPGNRVVRRATHDAPVRSFYCRAAMTEPENTSTVLELYTRFLKCFVSAILICDLDPRLIQGQS